MKTITAGVCLALFSAALQSHAVQYFQYDKADTTVASTTLERPLFYDASVVTADGKTYVTWLEFQPSKRDIVWFGIRDSAGKWLEKKQITEQSADCANPTLTRDKAGNIWLTYESAVDGKWSIFATLRNDDGAIDKPIRVSKANVTSVSHRVAAAADGGIWIVWQGDNRGQFDIFARDIKKLDNSDAQPVQISDSPRGDWHPSIAITPDGDVFIAWDSYDGTAYNIRSRERHNAAWGNIMNVTASPNFNANPDITSDQNNRVYIAWEEDGPNWGKPYRTRTNAKVNSTKMSDDLGSVHRFRQLHLGELIKDNSAVREIEVPQPSFAQAAARKDAPAGIKKLGVFYQSPQLTTDASNHVWLAYRHFYMPTMGITQNHHMQNDWGIYARCFENGTWSKLFRFDYGQGDALQRIAISPTTNGISVAYTFGRTDRRNPQNYVEDEIAPNKVVKHVSKKRGPSGDDEGDEESAAPKKPKQARTRNQANDDEHPLPSDGRGVAIASVTVEE
ncbi:MAG: hypothetical protein JWO95_422, partial [Verrucomicrobiales bacterium]|nr:hypothetical protein [Verrucomicrobiales bacterium]